MVVLFLLLIFILFLVVFFNSILLIGIKSNIVVWLSVSSMAEFMAEC